MEIRQEGPKTGVAGLQDLEVQYSMLLMRTSTY